MRGLYKYPQAEFPYARLVEENRRRGRRDPEFELARHRRLRRGPLLRRRRRVREGGRRRLLIRITVTNRGPEPAPLHLLPTLWFRNTWSWEAGAGRPRLRRGAGRRAGLAILVEHAGPRRRSASTRRARPSCCFTENETNQRRLYGVENAESLRQGRLSRGVVHGDMEAVNPAQEGIEGGGALPADSSAPGESAVAAAAPQARGPRRLREPALREPSTRCSPSAQAEADEFYGADDPGEALGRRHERDAPGARRDALVQAVVPLRRAPLARGRSYPARRPRRSGKPGGTATGRISTTTTSISMPDKWEYPWYAAWDLAFHTIALALVDPGVRQGAADPVPARVVHAPERPDPRLRVGASAT